MTTQTPKLRFPEFADKWEVKKLGEIGEIITGSTPSTANDDFYNGEYQFVSPYDINENRWVIKTKTTLTKSGFLKGRKIRKGGSLFVCIGSTIGKIGQASIDCITNQQINSIVSNNQNDDFIYSLLEKHSSIIKMLAAEQAVPIINKTTFSNYSCSLPQLPEQTKIANFLTVIDEKIQALKQKKSLLEQYKKGIMQQIFSQELRFKSDDGADFDDWEEKTLGEVLDYEQPTKYLVFSTEYNDNYEIPVLTAGKTFILGYTNETEGVFKNNLPVIIFDDFTTANKFVNFPFKAKSSAMKILLPKKGINLKFIYEVIQSLDYVIGGHERHWISKYSILEIPFPSGEEQQKIANFLTAIDEKIEKVSQQISTTETYKKGLLQQMFI